MKLIKYTSISILILLYSCFREDDKITPHDPGDVIIGEVEMTPTYQYQVFYDLETNTELSRNIRSDWDLSFQSGKEGLIVRLNSSCFMMAAPTGTDEFKTVVDTTGAQWWFDKSNGDIDSLAIQNWVSFNDDSILVYSNEVFIIDRGLDAVGIHKGLKKVVFTEVDSASYSFTYANLDGSDEVSYKLMKDEAALYTYFSFENGGEILQIEPTNPDWDLLFTQYTTLLFTDEGDPYPYLLTGVLSKEKYTLVHRDTLINFNEITFELARELTYSVALDAVGYDWKIVTGDVGSGNVYYEIDPKLVYVIRTAEGYYYKLRFISFYNNEGEKGTPKFEFQQL